MQWRDREWKLLIGGEWVTGDGGTYPIVNPATEQVEGYAPEASVAQAEAAARAARDAFPAWAATPPAVRGALLAKVAEKLAERQADMVPMIIAETGATAMVGSRMQVPVAIERFTRYGRDAAKDIRVPLPPSPMAATPLVG